MSSSEERGWRLRPGERFRGMLVHSLLGEGGMGAAHLASHPVLRSPLVIKTFRNAPGKDPFAEAHLAARVRSPHVVEVVDAGWEDEVAFVLQRYVDGIDLEELLWRLGSAAMKPAVGVTARMLLDAARGLNAIHQCGIVHRDVKPANLFLGGNGVCCVGDFGVAVDVDVDAGSAGLSGTPLFMAPEQWEGGAIDRRTDLYALGCAAHMLLRGTPPFAADSLVEMVRAHTSVPFEPPSTDDPEEAYLLSVVARLLRKEPAERYANAEDLIRVLSVLQGGLVAVLPLPSGAHMGQLAVWIEQGDIATTLADVVVNAANRALRMQVGVAAALKAAGGDAIEAEAVARAPATMGDVVWTGAGTLRARWVAHAVAALAGAVCIQRCVLRLLLEAESKGARSVALPALGTGVGEVPMSHCALLTLEAIRTFSSLAPRSVRDVKVVLRDGSAVGTWTEVLRAM